jgi:hypothetical protein
MRLGLLAVPLLALPLACTFDSIGVPDGTSGDEVANTESETAADDLDDELGTDQGTTTEADDADDETTESTTDTTDDATDESTTESTTDTDDTTTDTTDTDDTTDDTTDTTTTETDDSDSETTGMDETYYGACPNGADDCALNEVCKTDIDINDSWYVCAIPCEDSNDCPLVEGHPLTCISYGFQPEACHIDCAETSCPQGMSCKSVNVGFDKICAWDA